MSRNRVRTRLAIGLTVSTLAVVALVGIGATCLAVWRSDDPATQARAGAARVGEDVAVVVIAEDAGADAASDARRDTLEWMLVALAASLVPAVLIGWLAAGRLLGTVDRALADIEATENERQEHLQEVVHELRTPLAVVTANLELVARDPDVDGETADFLDASRRAAERMRRTVDDLAGHGRLSVDGEAGPSDLAVEATAVVAKYAGPAHNRSLGLATIGEPRLPVPSADRGAVRIALGNLVGNAVRLAPRGSKITIRWGKLEDWAWMAVGDEGPGMAPSLHPLAFERGWRGRHDRDRAAGADPGRGLGLTIARQVVEAQGGALTVESDEGAGSTFTIWLPLTADATRADVVAEDGIHPRSAPWLDLSSTSS